MCNKKETIFTGNGLSKFLVEIKMNTHIAPTKIWYFMFTINK